jgi:hypothetical protein
MSWENTELLKEKNTTLETHVAFLDAKNSELLVRCRHHIQE